MLVPYYYAFGAILCWASLPVATGSSLDGMSPEELMFYSFSIAAIFLYLQDVITGKGVGVAFPGVKVCLFGGGGIFLYHYVYYLALARAPLAEGTILATTWSLWIVIFSSILQLKRVASSILFAALLGFCGVGLVIRSGNDLSFASEHMQGYILALCCGVIWSSFSVGLPLFKLRLEPMTGFTLLAAFCSGILYIITFPHSFPEFSTILSCIYLGCVPLGLSFFLWNRAITTGNMVIIGFLSYFTPPLAVLMVAVSSGQAVSLQVITGMVLIVFASIMGKIFLQRLEKKEKNDVANG